MLMSLGGTPTWQLHTGLWKFVQNISTNIGSLWKRTDLKLEGVSCLFISYNIIVSWLYTLNGFQIISLIAWQSNPRIVKSEMFIDLMGSH